MRSPFVKALAVGTTSSKRLITSVSGRICVDLECSTILSTYNADEYCWVHRVKRKPRLRGTRELAPHSVVKVPKCRSCSQRNGRSAKISVNLVMDGTTHWVDLAGTALCDYESKDYGKNGSGPS